MEFRIKALDASSSVISCVVDAVDEAEARRQLALKDLKVISLEPMRRLRRLFRAPQLQLAVFSQQLVSLLDAGLSLVAALEALTRYIAYQEQADALRKTLVNACIYPAVLLAAGLLVTLFLMGYVVPRFSSIYEDVGSDLPFASQLLLRWGQLIDAHAGLVIVAAIAGLAGAIYGIGRPAVRTAAGAWLARIPAIGRQLHVYQLARLYRTVGMLVRGGIPVVQALRMSGGVVFAASRAAYAAATRAVTEGQSLAEAMERNGLTTAVAARMLRVGERSGNMGEMMERIADFFDEELARWVAVMTRLIEPVLMIVIGLIIGVIVVLMYFPIFQLAGSIR